MRHGPEQPQSQHQRGEAADQGGMPGLAEVRVLVAPVVEDVHEGVGVEPGGDRGEGVTGDELDAIVRTGPYDDVR